MADEAISFSFEVTEPGEVNVALVFAAEDAPEQPELLVPDADGWTRRRKPRARIA